VTDDRTLIIPSAASIASTDWAERIAPDEAERHALAAARLVDVQRDRDAQYGSGRTLHRKQTAALRGRLSVHGELPDWARFGLFARAGVYECWVRLSNGSMNRSSDAKADVRGLAIKVFGVEGASALGEPETLAQDFLLINQSAFAYPNSQEFVDFVVAAAGGKGRLVAYLMKRHGIFGGMNRVKALAARVKAPFAGYAHAPMYSAAPIACGPYAVRVRLAPDPGNGAPDPVASRNWGADVTQRLARQPLHWSLQLQPFINERDTPIEDASVDWPTPYETVATLELPPQAVDEALAKRCEAVAFDPWQALAAHRPLGELMRARKVIYFESQRERSAT
jgi:hypothetical protein